MVIYVERDAHVHMAQLMPLSLTVSCASVKSRLFLPFYYRLTRVVPENNNNNNNDRLTAFDPGQPG